MKVSLFALPLFALACSNGAHDATPAAPAAPAPTYATPEQIAPSGPGDGTKARVVSTASDGTKTWVLVLAADDDVMSALLTFVKKQNVTAAHFVAIGGVKDPEVGWFDVEKKQYKLLPLAEQVEVLTMSGDVALSAKGDPVVHAHAVFGRPDGTAWGGHVIKATVKPMLEVFMTVYPEALKKKPDPTFGIDRIDPDERAPAPARPVPTVDPLAPRAPAPRPTHGAISDPGF